MIKKKRRSAGIWLRVSTAMQVEETDSLDHHLARAEAYCQAKGWDVAEVYRLEGMSGKDVMKYPQTFQMLSDIKSGKIDTLIFSSLSRLARNTKQLLVISELFEKFGASLVSLKEQIDTTTPAGRMFFTLQSSLATFEAEETSERVKASVVTRAKMGKPLGGTTQFGYRWNKDKTELELHPDEAPIRKEAFNIFLDCERIKTTARILNEKGYRTRRGYKFSDHTVKNMLTDPLSKGRRRANYSAMVGKLRIQKPQSEWIYSDAPAVVTEEIFDTVQLILKKNKRPETRKARLPVHPFSGLVYCCCGEVKMRVLSSIPDKYTCPTCRSKIPIADLEEVYKSQLQKVIITPQMLSEYSKQVHETLDAKKEEINLAKKQLAELMTKSQKYLDLYVDNQLDKQTFERHNAPLSEQISSLEVTIPELEEDIQALKEAILHEAELVYTSENLRERWDGIDPKDRVRLIAQLTNKIIVCGDKIDISLNFIPAIISGNKAMQEQGFIAAIKINFAGKRN